MCHSVYCGEIDDGFDISFFRLVVESLSAKVDRANSHTESNLSWKQRSIAKKHGWGACNAVRRIFSCQSAVREEASTGSCCLKSFQILVNCFDKFWTMNDKVTLSAIGAMLALDSKSLTQVAGRSGVIGNAISICTLRLFEVSI